MDAYNLETFKAFDRYRYLRSNFVAAFHGGSQQHRKRDLGTLRRRGLLSAPAQQKDSANYRYAPRIYELSPKGKAALIASGITPIRWIGDRHFWHQLMVADIVMSFEIACKKRGLAFRHRKDIIGAAPLVFPTTILHQFPKHSDHYSGVLQPDELFAINDTYFILDPFQFLSIGGVLSLTVKPGSLLRRVKATPMVIQSFRPGPVLART
jgi:hypothetical protein